MLDDDDKISFSFSAMSEINSKLLPENRMEGAHILPQDQDSLSGDCDKELTINITRIAKKTIDKMI
jgi:hypothetical protein